MWSLSNATGPYSQGEGETLERMAGDICSAISRAKHDIPNLDDKVPRNETADSGF